MKKLFTTIRKGDLDAVKDLLAKNPSLIHCTAKQPPKKDDGQSPLQVAIKTGHFKIANLLLDCGADVNFMESEDCANRWRMPVLQDAIRASILSSRWNTVGPDGQLTVYSTQEEADQSYCILKKMLSLGADIRCLDSFGNSCLERAILDASQILPKSSDRILTPELYADLSRIFQLLFDAGADVSALDRYSGKPLIETYQDQPIKDFLNLGT